MSVLRLRPVRFKKNIKPIKTSATPIKLTSDKISQQERKPSNTPNSNMHLLKPTQNIYVVNPLASEPIDLEKQAHNEPTKCGGPEYFYNDRGWLIFNEYTYAHRIIVKNASNIVFWECRNRKDGCMAKIKAEGRELAVINGKHNHPPSCPKALKPIIFTED